MAGYQRMSLVVGRDENEKQDLNWQTARSYSVDNVFTPADSEIAQVSHPEGKEEDDAADADLDLAELKAHVMYPKDCTSLTFNPCARSNRRTFRRLKSPADLERGPSHTSLDQKRLSYEQRTNSMFVWLPYCLIFSLAALYFIGLLVWGLSVCGQRMGVVEGA